MKISDMFFNKVFAQGTTGYESLSGIESQIEGASSGNLPEILNGLFIFGVSLAGALAVIMLVVGGVQYMTSEALSMKEEGKKRMTSAIWGLLLVLFAYLILYTINPDLLKLDFSRNLPQQSSLYNSGASSLQNEAQYQAFINNLYGLNPNSSDFTFNMSPYAAYDAYGESNTIGINNNNWGNIKSFGPSTEWDGMTGVDEYNHAVFSSPDMGARAFYVNLYNQYDGSTINTAGNPIKTVNQFVNNYTSVAEDRASYISYLESKGFSANSDIGLRDSSGNVNSSTALRFASAVAEFESRIDTSKPESQGVLNNGLNLALPTISN